MKLISFNIYEQFEELIKYGYNIEEISDILSMSPVYVKDIVIELRRDLINECDESKFHIIDSINSLIGRYELHDNSLEIIEFIKNNDISVACTYFHININTLSHILKGIYVDYYLYGTEKAKIELSSIKKAIDMSDIIVESKKGSKEKTIYPDSTRSAFSRNGKKSLSSNACVKTVYDFGEPEYLRVLVISDTHYGNIEENMSYLDSVYEYASKYGISVILHGGDLIEGTNQDFAACKEEYKSSESQIEHVLDDYLFDKSITSFFLLGNHDLTTLTKDRMDLFDMLSLRSDFVPLGYRQAFIKCGREYISIRHNVPKMINPTKEVDTFLNLSGHSHIYNASHNNQGVYYKVPTLSDVSPNKTIKTSKGFIDIEMWFVDREAVEIKSNYIRVDGKKDELVLQRRRKK